MKVAVVTDDMETVSAHFGRAEHYLVYVIEDGVIRAREARDKASHGPRAAGHNHVHGSQSGESNFHDLVLSNIRDCDVVIAGGMGWPMYDSITAAGLKPFITQVKRVDDAVKALIDGRLDNHVEFLH